MGETNALSIASEAESLASDTERSERHALLSRLLEADHLEVRISPLAGWSPDFSVFTAKGSGIAEAGEVAPAAATVLIGPHWFERPYPHPGPAFVVALQGEPAVRAGQRFEEAWRRGHDLRGSLLSLIREALRRGGPSNPGCELTPFSAYGYSLRAPSRGTELGPA
jgi:hypothetical protein